MPQTNDNPVAKPQVTKTPRRDLAVAAACGVFVAAMVGATHSV